MTEITGGAPIPEPQDLDQQLLRVNEFFRQVENIFIDNELTNGDSFPPTEEMGSLSFRLLNKEKLVRRFGGEGRAEQLLRFFDEMLPLDKSELVVEDLDEMRHGLRAAHLLLKPGEGRLSSVTEIVADFRDEEFGLLLEELRDVNSPLINDEEMGRLRTSPGDTLEKRAARFRLTSLYTKGKTTVVPREGGGGVEDVSDESMKEDFKACLAIVKEEYMGS